MSSRKYNIGKSGVDSVAETIMQKKKDFKRSKTSLVAQWLRLSASIVGGMGLIPGQGTRILSAAWPGQKKRSSWPQLEKGKLREYKQSPKLKTVEMIQILK